MHRRSRPPMAPRMPTLFSLCTLPSGSALSCMLQGGWLTASSRQSKGPKQILKRGPRDSTAQRRFRGVIERQARAFGTNCVRACECA
eukprot:6622668-Alexandrium_andersonii.AAC.1